MLFQGWGGRIYTQDNCVQGSARRTAEGRALLVADLVDHVHDRGHDADDGDNDRKCLLHSYLSLVT